MFKSAAAALGIVMLMTLTACPHATPKPKVPKPIDLDDGALHLVPVSRVTPKVSRAQAALDFDYSGQWFVKGPVAPVLGEVTTAVAPVPTRPAVANLRKTLAWVYITHPNFVYAGSCLPHPFNIGSPSNATRTPSKAFAFIVDASTGKAYSYTGAGFRACGYWYVPEMSAARMTVSVPWTYRNHTWRISLPPCGQIADFGSTGANAFAPIGPCSKKATVLVEHESSNVRVIPGKPRPLGVQCGTAYDPAIPKPSTCAKV